MSERHVTVDIIIAAVAAVTGIDRNDILADRREAVRVSTHEIVALCQVAVAALGEPPPGDADPSEPASEPVQETPHEA